MIRLATSPSVWFSSHWESHILATRRLRPFSGSFSLPSDNYGSRGTSFIWQGVSVLEDSWKNTWHRFPTERFDGYQCQWSWEVQKRSIPKLSDSHKAHFLSSCKTHFRHSNKKLALQHAIGNSLEGIPWVDGIGDIIAIHVINVALINNGQGLEPDDIVHYLCGNVLLESMSLTFCFPLQP